MAMPILELEGTGAEIVQRLSEYGDRRIHVIVLPATEPDIVKKDERPITEMLAEIAAHVASAEADQLPADFTDQLDHYLYGSPKR